MTGTFGPYPATVLTTRGIARASGRFDGSITLPDGRDLAATMIADGFAVAYLP